MILDEGVLWCLMIAADIFRGRYQHAARQANRARHGRGEKNRSDCARRQL
jgi:hypothetical protein